MIGVIKSRVDYFGALAGGLCLIHCLATPFVFVAKACSMTCCDAAPGWWKLIDVLFLGVSFIAIFFAGKRASKRWLVGSLWVFWMLLGLVVLNDFYHLIYIPQLLGYTPAIMIIGLHIYNQRTCNCNDEACCPNE